MLRVARAAVHPVLNTELPVRVSVSGENLLLRIAALHTAVHVLPVTRPFSSVQTSPVFQVPGALDYMVSGSGAKVPTSQS